MRGQSDEEVFWDLSINRKMQIDICWTRIIWTTFVSIADISCSFDGRKQFRSIHSEEEERWIHSEERWGDHVGGFIQKNDGHFRQETDSKNITIPRPAAARNTKNEYTQM